MNEIIDNIKHRFKNAGIVEQLIYANLAVFLLVFIFNTFGFLFKANTNFLVNWLALPSDTNLFLIKPWTIITYGFLHTKFLHILFNLIGLFYIGHLFKEYFTSKQVLNFYIYGTIFGGILFILSYNFFPVFSSSKDQNILMGASAGVYAILVGIATYLPNYQFKIPLIGFIKLWHIVALWIFLDIIQIPVNNAGGHFAHLGGALFGFFYVYTISNKKLNFMNPFKELFKKKEKKLKTVYNSGNKTPKGSYGYKSKNQREIDEVLEKIKKSGYDSLTQEEKDFLFKQGKN